MTEAPERITKIVWLYHPEDMDDIANAMAKVEYVRADLARPVTVAEAAKVLLDEWDMHGEGFIGELACHSPDEFGQMDADLDGEWVRFSKIESVLRAMSHEDDDICTGCQGSGWDGNRETVCHCQPGE